MKPAAAQPDTWSPQTPLAVDWEFAFFDLRTRPGPMAVMVDATATNRHKKPGLVEARMCAESAAYYMAETARLSSGVFGAAYATLWCLWGLRALGRVSPAALLAPVFDQTEATARFSTLVLHTTRDSLFDAFAAAVLSVARPVENSGEMRKGEVWGWAWSAYLSGVMTYIDAHFTAGADA